jgi:hypothetical protein
VVFVDPNNFAAHSAGDFAQFTFLISGRLVNGRNPEVEQGAFHRKALSRRQHHTCTANQHPEITDFIGVAERDLRGVFPHTSMRPGRQLECPLYHRNTFVRRKRIPAL